MSGNFPRTSGNFTRVSGEFPSQSVFTPPNEWKKSTRTI